jgi:uncharacterized protein YndB with AHSA1/START domain
MIEFTIETEIARAPAEVFAYVTDVNNLATWQTNTISAVVETDGPLGVGARIREVHRAPGGMKIEELVEVAEYEPDRVLGLRNIEGPPIGGRITLEPTEHGTHFRFRVYGHPTGAQRLIAPLIKLVARRQFGGFCATLKHVLEDTTPAS